MGLDNGFVLKHSDHKDLECEIAYFRNYYELDGWIRHNCEETYKGSEWFKITIESLKALKDYIKPIYDVLVKIDDGLISKYDDTTYNKSTITKIEAVAYSNEFSPLSPQSSFAGHKLIHLYQSILSMIEILDIQKLKDDEEDKIWFIEFYSSY